MRTRSLAVLLLLAACSPSSPPAASPPPAAERAVASRLEVVRVRVDSADADLIGPARLRTLVPRIARVQAEPSEIRLRVGESYPLSRVNVVAFDTAGRRLGRLAISDRRLASPVAALMVGDSVRAKQPGEAVLTVKVPLWSQYGGRGPAPEAPVMIRVQ